MYNEIKASVMATNDAQTLINIRMMMLGDNDIRIEHKIELGKLIAERLG